MSKQTRAKQERVIEAVRQGLEGESAVEFIRQSGYAMTLTGIARHLRSMGGRGAVAALIEDGKSNIEIMEICFPDASHDDLPMEPPPSQPDLFVTEPPAGEPGSPKKRTVHIYETRKMSIKVPADLYDAIRIAAKAEGLSQNQLIVDILTSALSRAPHFPQLADGPSDE